MTLLARAGGTTVPAGRLDPFDEIDPSRAEPMLDELPDAELELIPEAGHTSNLERPEPVNEAIRSFLDAHH